MISVCFSVRPYLWGEDRQLKEGEEKRRSWIIPCDFAEFILLSDKRVKYLSAGGSRMVTVRNSWNICAVSCLLWYWAFLLAVGTLQRHVSILLSKCGVSSICKQGSVTERQKRAVLPGLWLPIACISIFAAFAGFCKLNIGEDYGENIYSCQSK